MKYFYEYKIKNGAKVGGHNLEKITIIDDVIILEGVDTLMDCDGEYDRHWRTLLKHNEIEYIKIEPMEEEEYQTNDYLIMNKNIIDVLNSIVWYNGIGDILLKLREDIINSEDKTYSKLKYKYDEFSNNQFEIFWMMLVLMYGDYGTSPRSGWLNMENKNEIISFIDQITKTTKEDFLNGT